MSNPIDPFEEYLRKKKVEMLEAKYRGDGQPGAEPAREGREGQVAVSEEEEGAPDDKLKQEMDDFFHSGAAGGAEYFSRGQTELTEDKVEEIRDALDDVFEEDAPVPQTAREGETFVSFFQQVQQTYGREEGPAGPDGAAVDTLPPPAVEPAAAPAPEPMIVEDFDPPVDPAPARRLNLADILLQDRNEVTLEQKVDVLCRIVAKLVERASLPESEIIEALIKAEVEF